MQTKNVTRLTLLPLALAAAVALTACGGGGGGGTTTTTSSSSSGGSTSSSSSGGSSSSGQTATSANVSPAQYAAGSIELGIFNTLNTARTTCGFGGMLENTTLDQAAKNHANYMSVNAQQITDTETAGNPGYTGVTYNDRADAVGFPSSTYVTGESAGYYTGATLTGTQYGIDLATAWLSGVYHIAIATWPITEIGIGQAQVTYAGYPQIMATNSIVPNGSTAGNLPLTYPCQGVTGVPYASVGESPTPPNVTGTVPGTTVPEFGQPVSVAGNLNDTITLSSATMTDTKGNVITLQTLDSANDPNKLLPPFEAVAYPASALTANMTYVVNLSGTYNGQPFSRSFSFTTGNVVA